MGRGDGHLERARVGVADVLAGEDHHPPREEAGVLAALEHRGEVEQRRVGVRAAGRLDPGRDQVVVAVAALVVEHGTALQRVLGVAQGHAVGRRRSRTPARAPRARCARRRRRARPGTRARRRRRAAGPAPRARRSASGAAAPAPARPRARAARRRGSARAAPSSPRSTGSRSSRRRGSASPSSTAGRSTSCCALLKRWISSRKRIVASPLVARRWPARSITSRTSWRPGVDRGHLLERGFRLPRHQARERRLAGAGRAVEHHRVRPPLVDRRPQRRAGLEQVLLADELVELARPHPRGERLVGLRHARLAARSLVLLEQPLHGLSLAGR